MSRKHRRIMKHMGLEKSVSDLFETAINQFKDSIEPFNNYRFDYNGIDYDIEPLVMLIPLLLGNVKNGGKSFKKEIHRTYMENEKNHTELYNTKPLANAGGLIDDICNEFSKYGLHANLFRAITIAKTFNEYDTDLGGYDFDINLKDIETHGFYQSNQYDELTLSQIFNSAINTFCLKIFESDLILNDFLSLYMMLSALNVDDETKDILRFIKVLMDYFLTSKQKSSFPLPVEISGDLEKDVAEIGEEYLETLKLLDNDIIALLSIIDMIDVTNEEKVTIDSYEMYFKFTLIDFAYKSLSYNRLTSIEQLEALNKKDIGTFKKDIKKLTKQNKDLDNKLKQKDKEISKLNQSVKDSKNKNKEEFYLNKIKELENKVKAVENKYVGANNRVKSLEDKLAQRITIRDIEEVAVSTAQEISNEITEEVMDNEEIIVSYEDKLSVLRKLNFFVVGGNTNFFGRLKSALPNSRHIDILNEGCNFTVPKSIDCILNISKVTTHSHIKRAEAQVSNDIPTIKISTYQISEIINIVYDILYK